MVITIEDGRVKDIIFSDERMYSYMEQKKATDTPVCYVCDQLSP